MNLPDPSPAHLGGINSKLTTVRVAAIVLIVGVVAVVTIGIVLIVQANQAATQIKQDKHDAAVKAWYACRSDGTLWIVCGDRP